MTPLFQPGVEEQPLDLCAHLIVETSRHDGDHTVHREPIRSTEGPYEGTPVGSEQNTTLLFGRVTWQMMASYWPTAEGDIATFMNAAPKYVFSRTLDKAEWNNTTLVKGDAVAAVKELKQQSGKDIYVFGSADFSATLKRHGLIDEYRIGVNPVLLGKGIPLFKDSDARVNLRLIHSRTLKSGVMIAHYEPAM